MSACKNQTFSPLAILNCIFALTIPLTMAPAKKNRNQKSRDQNRSWILEGFKGNKIKLSRVLRIDDCRAGQNTAVCGEKANHTENLTQNGLKSMRESENVKRVGAARYVGSGETRSCLTTRELFELPLPNNRPQAISRFAKEKRKLNPLE